MAPAVAPANMQVVGSVALPSAIPRGIVVDTATDRVYVADGGSSVRVFDRDLNPLGSIATGSGTYRLGFDARAGSKRLFVARYPGSVGVFSLPSGSPICDVGGIGGGINGVQFNPNTEKAYVPVEVPPHVAVLGGPNTCSSVASVATDNKPLGLAVDTVANRIYAPAHHAETLAVIDGFSDSIDSTYSLFGGDPLDAAVDPVNHRAYIAYNLGSRVTMVGTGPAGTGPYSFTDLIVGSGPITVATDPGLDRAYVALRDSQQLRPITAGSVGSPVNLPIIPYGLGPDLASHCVFVAGNTGSDARLLKVCDAVPDTTAPVLQLPAPITVDATGPGGASVSYSVSATDDTDPSPSVSCAPASGAGFPIGTTSVNCTATDASGNSAHGSFTVTVRSAGEQIDRLLDTIAGLGLPQGTANSLSAKLRAARAAKGAQQAGGSGCGELGAFLNEVSAQSGKKLTTSQAQQLTDAANRIRAVLGC